MKCKIYWTAKAVSDLKSASLANKDGDDLRTLERYGKAILAKVRLLEKYPLLGSNLPETLDPELRELPHPPYRIIYRVNEREQSIGLLRIVGDLKESPQNELHDPSGAGCL